MPTRRVSTLRRKTGIKRGKPLRKRGKRAYKAKRPAGYGACTYCGKVCERTWDHVVPRSINPGKDRDHPDNLVPACWDCNIGRTQGEKPEWKKVPPKAQAFVLAKIGHERAKRYFLDVPEPDGSREPSP